MHFFNETSEFVNKEIKNFALKFVSRYTKQTTTLGQIACLALAEHTSSRNWEFVKTI